MNKDSTDELADRLGGLVVKLMVFNAKTIDLDHKRQNRCADASLMSLEGHNIKLFTYWLQTGVINRVLVVKIQRCLDKPPPTFKRFSFNCHSTNSSPKSIILSKPKTSRREYSDITVEIILALCEAGRLYAQIADQVKVPRPSVVHIIHQATHTQNELYSLTKRASRLPKLDIRA